MWILVDNQKYSGQNASFGKMYKFKYNESDQCKIITGLGSGKGLCLDQAARQAISSNNYESSYQWQQILNGQYVKMSIKKVLMIIGLVSVVIEQESSRFYV